ncbi:MAG: ABC transporter permease [Mycobacteriales bacterium]
MSRAPREHTARHGASLAWRQVGYQLLLLTRSPLGTFTVLVVPLMLLGALNIVNTQDSMRDQGYARYADFATPAMATFALLNAAYINVATSVVTSREAGVLKRLHSSPLPLWAYVVGRMGAATVVGGVAFWVVMLTGVAFLRVRLDPAQVGYLCAVMALGAVCFSLMGVALSAFVHTTDSALPVAYGSFLPIAFVSDIFFPVANAPEALKHIAAAFPVSAVSRPAEKVLREPGSGWPVTTTQLLVLLAWGLGAAIVMVALFSWEPGAVTRRLNLRRRAGGP